MKIIDCIQGSEEWHAARLGKVTGTGFADVLAKNRQGTGPGKTRKTYMIQLAAERLTGLPQDGFCSGAMDWGTEHEDEARVAYEAIQGVEVEQVGFVEYSENIGVSPDGFVGDKGMVEIKCTNSTTHIKTILSGKMPPKHNAQVQGNLWATGREWMDFVNFDPRMKSQRIFIVRVKRDQAYIDNLQAETEIFIAELEKMVSKIDTSPF